MFKISTILLLSTAAVSALPALKVVVTRAITNVSTDASCLEIYEACVSKIGPPLSRDVWSYRSCALAGACADGDKPLDNLFFNGLFSTLHAHSFHPTPATVTRLPSSVFGGAPLSQQAFIDAYYDELSSLGGPYPASSSVVIGYFKRIQEWTAFCNNPIPYSNFADYYQYSSTVTSPGCIPAVPNPPTNNFTISSNPSCQKIFQTCASEIGLPLTNDVWSHKSCVLAASCADGDSPVQALIRGLFGSLHAHSYHPSALLETRLAASVFGITGQTLSQQQFIDAYYGELSRIGGPYPSGSAVVVTYFKRIQTWTAFCGKAIPFSNLADYFQYSPTVSSPGLGCS